MKLIYTLCILITFSVPMFSQSHTISVCDSSQKDKITPELLDKLKKLSTEIPNNIQFRTGEIKIMPIPPATHLNSKSEALPLFKPGNVVMKLLNEKSDD